MLREAARSSILVIALAIAGCGGGAMGPAPPIDKATYVPPSAELMAPGPLGERVMGKPTAPVTVIEYVSLTCPHCANFQKNLFPRLKKEYIDTGKVRYVVREFPIGRTAGTAAIVNRCAPEEKYFFILDQFLTRQPEWVSQEVRPDAIYSVAKAGGMSRETFDKCLSNQVIIDGGQAAGAPIQRHRHADLLHQWPQGARRGQLRRDQGHDRAGSCVGFMTFRAAAAWPNAARKVFH